MFDGGLLISTPAMRLLIVEDEEDLRHGLSQALQEEGYAVDAAADGKEAIYKAENWDYDTIVLDVMLPGLDGWQILERLRKKKKTPVLLLTARDGVRDRVKGLDLGADDYLVKPFNLPELLGPGQGPHSPLRRRSQSRHSNRGCHN